MQRSIDRRFNVRFHSCLSATIATLFLLKASAFGQLIHQETFETDGDGTRYELIDRGHEDTNLPDRASGWGIWGHNFDAIPEEIGIASTAPDKRAAILWNHEDPLGDFDELVSNDSLDVWVSLAKPIRTSPDTCPPKFNVCTSLTPTSPGVVSVT